MPVDLPMTQELTRVVADARKQTNRHGERFNIFSILKMHRNEVETHSRFLYELLNPRGRHGEGDVFLMQFLNQVLGLHISAEGRYQVTRELATEEKRRVDMVIETPDTLVGIELKVDAADQYAQLRDYYRELQRRADDKKHIVMAYLTLDGKPPSSMSLGGLSQEAVVCLSFADDVSSWLQGCIDSSQHKPTVAYAIEQYRQTIDNLTGKGSTVSDIVAGELHSDVERFKEALAVEKSLPQAKAAVQKTFWQELKTALEKQLGVSASVYGGNSIEAISEDYYAKNRNNKRIGIKVPIGHVGNKHVVLYVNLYNAVHYGIRVEDASGAVIADPDLREAFRKDIGEGNAMADADADWLVCYYSNPGMGDAEKVINFDKFNSAAVGLLDDEVRHSLMADMVTHQTQLFEQAKKICS